MAINKDSNGFTFAFAGIMVVVVGTLLAVAAMGLKDRQQQNITMEKMKDILSSIQIMGPEDDMKKAPALFEKYVKERVVLSSTGEVVSQSLGEVDPTNVQDAFNIDVQGEYKSLAADQRNYPLYICEVEGEKFYVIPMVGTGLWGPIWGYIALESDLNTVYGAKFDHKGETPGLGAEINQKPFQEQFRGELIFGPGDEFKSITVQKGGTEEADKHAVDAITGGTITSNGVTEMINRTLQVYVPYIQQAKNELS